MGRLPWQEGGSPQSEAVDREVTRKPDSACRVLLDAPPWLHVREVEPRPTPGSSARACTPEKSRLWRSRGMGADLVVMDDNAAKKTAEYLGLNVTGTLGVLVKAKESGSLDAVAPVLARMKANGFYLSDRIERIALEAAGEA